MNSRSLWIHGSVKILPGGAISYGTTGSAQLPFVGPTGAGASCLEPRFADRIKKEGCTSDLVLEDISGSPPRRSLTAGGGSGCVQSRLHLGNGSQRH